MLDRLHTFEHGPTWGEFGGMILGLPELRGYWPLGHRNAAGQTYDQSGQGRVLSMSGTPTTGYLNNVVPYHIFNGVNQYLTRADENDLDITGGLTIGGWFNFGRSGGIEFMFGKTGAANLSYTLGKSAGDIPNFNVSATGAAAITVSSLSAVSLNAWYFIVGRYTPSTELAIWQNNVKNTNVVGIPAALFSGTGVLGVGAYIAGAIQYLQGYVANLFLCADSLPDVTINRLWRISRVFYGV